MCGDLLGPGVGNHWVCRVLELESLAGEIGGQPSRTDLTRPGEVVELLDRAAELAGGPIDVLVNNAGMADIAPFATQSAEVIAEEIQVNLGATDGASRRLRDLPGASMSEHDHHDDPRALRAEALEPLLVERGIVDPAAVDGVLDYFEQQLGPQRARVVVEAWLDPSFKRRLLEDGTGTVHAMGLAGPEMEHLVVVESTEQVHNVVVYTLCSCYPWALLGLPPSWYKSLEYRSRMVRGPRVVPRITADPRRKDRRRCRRGSLPLRPGDLPGGPTRLGRGSG